MHADRSAPTPLPVQNRRTTRRLPLAQAIELAAKADLGSVSPLAGLIARGYRFGIARGLCLKLIRRLEGGDMYSATLRRILKDFHGVEVGRYSYGPCLTPGALPSGTRVGNYCSIASGLQVFRRNHPGNFLSQHPFFYNRTLGLLAGDAIVAETDNPLVIEHDVWIGSRVTILPSCRRIGNGSILGAGSVVTRDIPAYTIWGGNPARFIRPRFEDDVRALVEKSLWWALPLQSLISAAGDLLNRPLA